MAAIRETFINQDMEDQQANVPREGWARVFVPSHDFQVSNLQPQGRRMRLASGVLVGSLCGVFILSIMSMMGSGGNARHGLGGTLSLWGADCSPLGQNCKMSKCCLQGGTKCFAKNASFAACLPDCNRAVSEWSCLTPEQWDVTTTTLPTTTRMAVTTLPTQSKKQEEHPADTSNVHISVDTTRYSQRFPNLLSKCADKSENCFSKRCCNTNGLQCFAKNTYWGTCKETCAKGVQPNDPNPTPWTCDPLGPVQKDITHGLFCFLVMRAFGDELQIVQNQRSTGQGIYACDAHAAFSDQQAPGLDVTVLTSYSAKITGALGGAGAQTSSWTNTGTFIAAWSAVVTDGEYSHHKWTIKVDPDTVLIPDRVRGWIEADPQMHSGKGDDGSGVYIKNCATGPKGLRLFGSMEMLSKEAVDTYKAQGARCDTEFQHDTWGEDYYMNKCFDLIGLTSLEKYDVLADNYCTGHGAGVAVACGSKPKAVALHAYKTAYDWNSCLKAALKVEPEPNSAISIFMKK